MSLPNLNLWENFIEPIAQILSKALTDKETERILSSWSAFQRRLRELSSENLKKLTAEASYLRPYCKHPGTCSNNAFRGFVRSFVVVFACKYGLGFFPYLLSGAFLRNPSLLWRLAGKDTVRFSIFLSCFIAIYKAFLCYLRRTRQVDDKWNAFVAGSFAGLSLLLDSNKSRRVMIALYLSTRTVHFVSKYIWKYHLEEKFDPYSKLQSPDSNQKNSVAFSGSSSRELGKLRSDAPLVSPIQSEKNTPTASQDDIFSNIDPNLAYESKKKAKTVRELIRRSASVLVMMLSSSQILYSFVAEPESLAKPYLSFLIVHGGVKSRHPILARKFLKAFGGCVNSFNSCPSSKFICPPSGVDSPIPFAENIPKGLSVEDLLPFAERMTAHKHEFVLCSMQHDHTPSCTVGIYKQFSEGLIRSFEMYGPLNLFMMAVFKWKECMKRPSRALKHLVLSTIRSSLFLSSYVTVAWCLPCYFRRAWGTDRKWMYYVNGLAAGLMVMIESPGRQFELAMYCVPRALESLWKCLVKWGYTRNIRYGEAMYFSLSTGVVMTLYQNDPECIQDGFRKIMARMIGVN